MREKYKIRDQGNIKKHLRDLQYHPYSCIDKIPTRKGYANKWDIKRIENLKNIRLHFPEIQLNIHKKSLYIISRHRGFDLGIPYANMYQIQLFLSSSFFDICLKNVVETLYTKADEICRLSKGARVWRHMLPIKESTNKFYTEFMKKILTNSNSWLDLYNECINDSLKSEISRKSLRFSEDIYISEETFRKIVGGSLPVLFEVMPGEELYKAIILELSSKIALETIALKISKDMNIDYKKVLLESGERIDEILDNQLANIIDQMSEEFFNRMVLDENWKDTLFELLAIAKSEKRIEMALLELLFDHCFQRDIIDGNASVKEKEFMYENYEFLSKSTTVKDYDNFLKDYFKKCRAEMRVH